MSAIERIGIPLVLTLFAFELILTYKRQENSRVVKDMLANLMVGLSTLFTGLLMKVVSFGLFSLVYAYALFKPHNSISLWIAGMVACDFVLYVYHLLGHKTRLFWAAHVTHHSSLYFNISIGFRVNCIHNFYRFVFWAPLCLLGVPPWMILFYESTNSLYNVLIHTEKIKKLGFLDLIFNTPSNHRVHHGSNPQYLDKNMGGILILFDHLFGTYEPEREKPIYGITHNIHTHNPITILIHEYKAVFNQLSLIKGWREKIKFLLSPPGEVAPEKSVKWVRVKN